MNIIENIEKEQMEKLTAGKNMPNFKPGDTLKVHTKVKEGDRERIQVYEGVCIALSVKALSAYSRYILRMLLKLKLLVSVKSVVRKCTSCVLCVAVLLVLQTIWLLLQRLVKKLPLLNKRKQKVMEKPPFGAVFLC